MTKALLVIDLQNDFMAGGALPAQATASLVEPVNFAIKTCAARGLLCVLTRDWHPPDHWSFATMGGPWPVHCVQNTFGAAIHAGIEIPDHAWIIDKGSTTQSTGYSDFEQTELVDRLRRAGVTHLGVCGIATDYCVKTDVLDAIKRGFQVSVLTDLIRPVEVAPGDGAAALSDMEKAGARITTSAEWVDSAPG